ncbi:MAG: ATP-dependent RNA helicase [Treponemataceae bacterium]
MNYKKLPVYAEKQKILDCLKENQVVVVESPTGSGKTTQLPVILHEAGYSERGMIGVTQPRRIAALSVSEFIAKQLNTEISGLVGYKMRFADKTSPETKIKIMTDGILLQELKLDPWLSKYSVIMVDEAHERSLNIDFVLGLLKRILKSRSDFKVIVSSATINTEMFSLYFDECPIVKIDAENYPVTLIFDPPEVKASTESATAESAMLEKIASIMSRIVLENRNGAVLIFLPGERVIKNCVERLASDPVIGRKLFILPLYGRLSKEEQERVFDKPPFGKRKVVIATNIAETSITINDIVTVIDSGLAKLNHHNPFTFTSSLIETDVSKASCNQRRGRAGRTQAGVCYRLYSKKDFEAREMYTTEEIYRTDLSEVVLRMSELGIYDFEDFYFLSPPGKKDIIGAIDTLNLLSALNSDRSLSNIGKLMCAFPLSPRQSRMIVEAILHFPRSIEEVIIAASFLSARSPFIFPEGYELEATQAHKRFYDEYGDFVSFLHIFRKHKSAENKIDFCKRNYLDERIMAEITNIKEQLELIVGDLGIPILGGGSREEYLHCVSAGMIQFLCAKERRDSYRSLTAEKIFIHPGSCVYKRTPEFIVAGEIIRTSRMYAMSVSPLPKSLVEKLAPALLKIVTKRGRGKLSESDKKTKREKYAKERKTRDNKKTLKTQSANLIKIFDKTYEIEKISGKKYLVLSAKDMMSIISKTRKNKHNIDYALEQAKGLRVKVLTNDMREFLVGEKLSEALTVMEVFNTSVIPNNEIKLQKNFNLLDSSDLHALVAELPKLFRTANSKRRSKELGFVTLCSDSESICWFKIMRKFKNALHEAFHSIQLIATKSDGLSQNETKVVKALYTSMSRFVQ